MKRNIILTVLLLLVSHIVTAQNAEQLYKEGKALYDAKKYNEALPKLKAAADKGHKKAQYRMGRAFDKGNGVKEDNDPLRREVGYREGLSEAHLPYTDSYRVYGRGTPEAGKAALAGILDALRPEYWPTAVIAMNDMMAMGCQAEARRRGIQMPEQLSIIGCDDLFCAPYLCPALTSINSHQQLTGARAVQLLISGENKHETGDWELVERASCARIHKGG